MLQIVAYVLSGLAILLGLVGVVLPMVPGVSLVFIGMLTIALVTKLSLVSYIGLVALFLLTIASILVDYFSGVIGAKYSGASLWGVVGAFAGAIFGFTIFGLIGVLIGSAVFVLIFELLSKRSIEKSAKSASYTLFSTTLGVIINLVIVLSMLAVFITALFI